MSRNAIFIAVNRKFFPHTLLFLGSLRRNYPHHPEILAYYTDLDPRQVRRLSRFPRLKAVRCELGADEVGPAMASLDPRQADPRASYIRFRIWSEALDQYDKILHLDTDMLVLKPLDKLFEEEEFTIFMETYRGECTLFYDHADPELLELLRQDGIEIPSVAANFGVFAAPRPRRTRAERELIFYFLRRYERFIKWADQSAINLWLAKKGIAVRKDLRFNFQHRLLDQDAGWIEGARQARVFHFNGVEPAYRVFLMRCADALFRVPGGFAVYGALYKTLRASFSAARGLKKAILRGCGSGG